jgi:hypothetical protein
MAFIEVMVSLNMMSCSLIEMNQRSGDTYCIHLLPWKWRQHISPECSYLSTRLQSIITSQQTMMLMFIGVRSSNHNFPSLKSAGGWIECWWTADDRSSHTQIFHDRITHFESDLSDLECGSNVRPSLPNINWNRISFKKIELMGLDWIWNFENQVSVYFQSISDSFKIEKVGLDEISYIIIYGIQRVDTTP